MRASWLAATALVIFSAPAAAQVYVPIPVTGYTQDVIADAVGAPSNTTTSAFDMGTGDANNVFFEQGYAGGTGALATAFRRTERLSRRRTGPTSWDRSAATTRCG